MKKNLNKVKAGKAGAEVTHRKRHEMINELRAYMDKADLDWVIRKWKTTHIARLLQAFKNGKNN